MSMGIVSGRSAGLKLGMLSVAAALAFGGATVAQADYASAVLGDNPLAYYRMQETHGATNAVNEVTGLADDTIYQYGTQTTDRIVLGGTGPITGGTAARVNHPMGNKDLSGDFGYLDVNTDDGNGDTLWTDNYTAELWFQVQRPYATTPIQYVFTRTDAVPGNSAALMGDGFGVKGSINPSGVAAIYSDDTHIVSGTNVLTLDRWYYAALTRDGNTLTLYIKELLEDGTAGFSETISGTRAIGSSSGAIHASFGARRQSQANLALGGDIAEVAIYNGALSQSQINAHFNAAIPEPGSLLLLGAGATMLFYRRRTVS